MLPHLVEHWRAFWTLSRDRQMGVGGAGAIPWTSIHAYALRYGIEGDHFDTFVAHIDTLDTAYRKHLIKGQQNGGS